MKFREIFRFELAHQLRRPWPWLGFAVLAVFAFANTRVGILPVTLPQDFVLNSPFIIASVTVFSCLIWLLVASVMAGEAAARDVQTGMHPLTYTAPVRKAEYLGGRFLAAFVLNALVLLGVQAGSLLAPYAGGIDPEIIGSFRPTAYVAAYGFIALPNAFIATTFQFLSALLTGRSMASYFGSVVLFFFTVPTSRSIFTPDTAGHRERLLRSVRALWTTTRRSSVRIRIPFCRSSSSRATFSGCVSTSAASSPAARAFFLLDPQDDAFDVIFEVAAHEMGHQWWGVQLKPAFAEGAGVISESLAWYSAMQLVKNTKGREGLRQFMSFMRQPNPWPPMRTGLPLLRAIDPWANYRKGPYALYALSEYAGAERVNGALRTMLENKVSSRATSVGSCPGRRSRRPCIGRRCRCSGTRVRWRCSCASRKRSHRACVRSPPRSIRPSD